MHQVAEIAAQNCITTNTMIYSKQLSMKLRSPVAFYPTFVFTSFPSSISRSPSSSSELLPGCTVVLGVISSLDPRGTWRWRGVGKKGVWLLRKKAKRRWIMEAREGGKSKSWKITRKNGNSDKYYKKVMYWELEIPMSNIQSKYPKNI